MSDQLSFLIFLLGTLALAWFSRASLRAPGSHGFRRFFAWEFILALVVRALSGWFDDPFSPRQLVSWALLVASALLAVHGFQLLKGRGEPSAERDEAGLIGVERTTRLVTAGAYRLIRHPLYASLLLLSWGALLKLPDGVSLVLAVGAAAFLWLTARAEEAENVRYFGEEYRAYMRRTRMFIPWLW